MNQEPIDKTRKLLNVINDYCVNNGLVLFSESRGYFYRLFVGSKETYKNLQETDVNLNYSILNKDFITNTYLNIFLHNGNMNCSIQSPTELSPKHFNELLLEVFWNCEKDISKIFFEHFDFYGQNINFNHIVNYTNKLYPAGFEDDRVRPYNNGLNWHHFLDMLPGRSIVNFFEDDNKRELFFKLMIEKENIGKLKSNSFLNKMNIKIKESTIEMSQNTQVEMSYLLMNLYKNNKNMQQAYIGNFPFIESLIKSNEKSELFKQEDIFIEQIKLPINDIYNFFSSSKLQADDYENLTNEIIINFNKNEELNNLGLITIDVARKDRDFICYLSLTNKHIINKDFFLDLYKESMNQLISENVVKIKNGSIVEKISNIIETIISKKILDTTLIKNPIETKRKLKV
jgi:hypothetical protein